MKLVGNILAIKNKRDDQHRNIEVHIDQIEYLTQRKDGHFFQPFDWVDELDTPLVLTGDCLVRTYNPGFDPEELFFEVYEREGDTYTLNPNKQLQLTLVYVEEMGESILRSGTYSVTVSNADFDQIRKERSKSKKQAGKRRR